MKTDWIGLCVALGFVFSCKKEPEPLGTAPTLAPSSEFHTVPPVAIPAPVTSTAAVATRELTWDAPPSWVRLPAQSGMRKATYRIPRAKADSDEAELAVFHFGAGQGGSIEANVSRWTNQFPGVKPKEVRREERSANGRLQHIVKIESATYSSGMPGGPSEAKSGWGLLGAIVEDPNGAYFFKLTGPTLTLKSAEKAFYQMLDSIKSSG